VSEQRLAFSIDLRHRGQINEVEVPAPRPELTADDLLPLTEAFFEKYERLYGRGSSFRAARLEAVTFRVRATAPLPKPVVPKAEIKPTAPSAEARRKSRQVYWSDAKKFIETPVFDGDRFVQGNFIAGPAIVETTDTTVVVHPGQKLCVDAFGNFDLALR
jgi:N-methylhydantoinase A